MNEIWDRLGISASILCILHCLLTPVLMLAAPLAHHYMAHGWFHFAIGAFVIPVGLWAFINGYRFHHRPRVLVVGALGLLSVTTALLWRDYELPLMIAGGSLLTWAHFINLRTCRCLPPKSQVQS